MESLHSYIPKEFVRCPRGLDEVLNFKATEFRQILLYTGVLIFKEKIPNEVYYEYLLLHCACRLLSTPKNLQQNIKIAQKLLNEFVKNFSVVFGENSISHNVHNILHLSDSVKEFGVLSNFSAYDFENYLQILKKYVKQPNKILQQIFNKIKNEKRIAEKKYKGLKENKFLNYFNNDYVLNHKSPNNICYLKPDIPFKLKGFNREKNVVFGNRFLNKFSFFEKPTDSMELDIASEEEEFPIEEIENKMLSFPYQNKFLLIPMLHGSF